jgi:hypothetical protein
MRTAIARQRALLLILPLLALGLSGCFKPAGEARAVRDRLVRQAGVRCATQFEFSVHGAVFHLVRAGLAFVDLDPEARAALTTLRGAGVGVYQLRFGGKACDRAALLSAADEAMTGRGWERVVGVLDGDEMVAVYVPRDTRPGGHLKVCAVVLDRDELVIASARTNPEPLIELGLRRAAGAAGRHDEMAWSHGLWPSSP